MQTQKNVKLKKIVEVSNFDPIRKSFFSHLGKFYDFTGVIWRSFIGSYVLIDVLKIQRSEIVIFTKKFNIQLRKYSEKHQP